MRKLLDAKAGARRSRDFWISQEFSQLYVWLVFVPVVILLASFGDSGILGVLFWASALPLLSVYALVFFSEVGLELPWWVPFERLLGKACRLRLPGLESGEEIKLEGYERTSGIWPKRGRLTLTDRRLLFQRPRWWFLPPWQAAPVNELRLSEIAEVEAERLVTGLVVFRVRGPFPRLSIRMTDGTKWQFSSMMARTWRRYILRARRRAV